MFCNHIENVRNLFVICRAKLARVCVGKLKIDVIRAHTRPPKRCRLNEETLFYISTYLVNRLINFLAHLTIWLIEFFGILHKANLLENGRKKPLILAFLHLLRSGACYVLRSGACKNPFSRILTAFKSILTRSVYLYTNDRKSFQNTLKMAIKKNGVYLLAYAADILSSINQ